MSIKMSVFKRSTVRCTTLLLPTRAVQQTYGALRRFFAASVCVFLKPQPPPFQEKLRAEVDSLKDSPSWRVAWH